MNEILSNILLGFLAVAGILILGLFLGTLGNILVTFLDSSFGRKFMGYNFFIMGICIILYVLYLIGENLKIFALK